MQFDKDISVVLGLDHNRYSIHREPILPSRHPTISKIALNLLEPCNTKELTDAINVKGIRTVEQYPKQDFVHAYTDGSSDEMILNGTRGICDYPG